MEALVRALSELYLMTARAGEASEDRKAVVALYARKLRDFPADIALAAIANYRGKFFPAFEELRELVIADDRLKVRRQKREALRAYLAGEQVSEGVKNPVTDAQIERMEAYARSLKAPAEMTGADDETIDRLAAFDAAMEETNAERKANRQEAIPYKRGNSFKSVEQIKRESEVLKKFARRSGFKAPAA